MHIRQLLTASSIALVAFASTVQAQRSGLVGDLQKDLTEAQNKLVTLAKQMPAAKYDWRPGTGVRSVREVFLHIAADNYFLPIPVGVPAPAATRITATDFAAIGAFEKQNLTQDATVAALEQSFAHLMKALADTPDSRLEDKVKVFGQDMTVRQLWLVTATHLHEHLGQAIAYARMNGVAPAWSRGN